MKNNTLLDWKKYLFTFIITAVIFGSAILLSNYFSQKKIDEIRNIQDKIAIDIMSSETQFSLLEESSCKDFGGGALSEELGSLEEKLLTTEKDRGSKDMEVQNLKRYYALLEIKDYILQGKISQKCKNHPLTIIYFYTTDGSCSDCEKEGYVLTDLRQNFPELKVYSFDYNHDLSAVKTLITINKVDKNLPAIIIKDKIYYGFQGTDDIIKAMPVLKNIQDAKNASSTKTTTNKK